MEELVLGMLHVLNGILNDQIALLYNLRPTMD